MLAIDGIRRNLKSSPLVLCRVVAARVCVVGQLLPRDHHSIAAEGHIRRVALVRVVVDITNIIIVVVAPRNWRGSGQATISLQRKEKDWKELQHHRNEITDEWSRLKLENHAPGSIARTHNRRRASLVSRKPSLRPSGAGGCRCDYYY